MQAISLPSATEIHSCPDKFASTKQLPGVRGRKSVAAGTSDLQKLSAGENCCLGMVAGVLAKGCNYPLLSWKNAVQQGLPVSFSPAVVYRGLPMACLNLGGTTAVQFGTTGFFQKQLANAGARGDAVQVGGAFLGGLASGVPCSMWELCMIQQQRHGGGMLSTPFRCVKEYGLTSLTRGLTMTMGREAMFTMAMLGITPVIQNNLVERSGMEKSVALAAGALTGACLSGTITHPLDTIKTCMQGDVGRVKFTGVVSTGRSLAAEYGVMQGLFKGLTFRVALISTTFFLVNSFKQQLCPNMFPDLAERRH